MGPRPVLTALDANDPERTWTCLVINIGLAI
jgi:hypothetical protein